MMSGNATARETGGVALGADRDDRKPHGDRITCPISTYINRCTGILSIDDILGVNIQISYVQHRITADLATD